MAKAKTGLGKGIDLLIPDALDLGEKKEEKLTLKTSQIEPNKNQPRKKFDKEALAELADSIKQYGIIEPIVVSKKDGYYEIIAGERRWRAAKMAKLKEVPVVIGEYSEKEIAEISLIENIQREDLNPVEEARAYKQLIDDYKLTQDELAKRVSKSRSAVTNSLRLLKLHSAVQEMLVDGALSSGHARALLALESQDDQLALAEKIVSQSLSVRQTEALVKEILAGPKAKKPAVRNDVAYKELESKMTESLGTKVCIKQKEKGKGRIEISYFSEDQLDSLFKLINKASK